MSGMNKLTKFAGFLRKAVPALAAGLALCNQVSAMPVTDPSSLIGAQTVINFSSLSVGNQASSLSFTGVTISGPLLNVIDTNNFAAPTIFPTYVSGNALGLPSVTQVSTKFTLTFTNAVAQVGFGIFDTNFPGNLITAYDSLGNILETTAPDALFPTGGSGADYVGFVRTTADIAKIDIIAGVSGNQLDALWIDNLAFSSNPVPEPASLALLGLGLAGLGWRSRKKA